MRHVRTLIVGAGQAGLALSWHLTNDGHDHIVVDRGDIAHRWRHGRWDSLHTLTPNWMSRLPGRAYDGPDPDGFQSASALAQRLHDYAVDFALPVETDTSVESVTQSGERFVVVTDRGSYLADNIVIATGWCDQPRVPAGATALPPTVAQLTAGNYRRPAQVPDGVTLVAGASASGLQIAEELQRAGRDVVLAVGRHTRLPRSYRGVDIHHWLEELGELDRGPSLDDERHRRGVSPQLVGRPASEPLDLGTLQDLGVRLTGRVEAITDQQVRFGDRLADEVAVADDRLQRLLQRIDAAISEAHFAVVGGRHVSSAQPVSPIVVRSPLDALPAGPRGIRSVVWATGYRRTYPWLHLPVFDRHGDIAQHRGVTAVPGCYTMGMQFQSRRRSTFIDGVRFDAAEIASRLQRTPDAAHPQLLVGSAS